VNSILRVEFYRKWAALPLLPTPWPAIAMEWFERDLRRKRIRANQFIILLRLERSNRSLTNIIKFRRGTLAHK
jgi:hypothetical protein